MGRAHGSRASEEAAAYARDPLAVSRLREQAGEVLQHLLRDPDPQVRANALEALSEAPQRLELALPAALRDENAGVRSTAAMMIGRVPVAALGPAVRPLLEDDSPFVRASAVYALWRCGLEVDPTPLAGMLLRDPSLRVRAHVAYLLGEMGEASASGLLREAVQAIPPRAAEAEAASLLVQIAEALVKLGDESQVEAIRARLYPSRPEDLEITALAVQVLGGLGDRRSVNELIYLTAYRDAQGNRMPAEVRLGAAGALARLGLDRGSFVADEYASSPVPALRAQAAFVYGQIGRFEDLPKLRLMLDDPAGMVRAAAAWAILRITAKPVPLAGP